VAPPGRCDLRAIAPATASGRGCDLGEGSTASFDILDFSMSWPVIAFDETAIILLIFGFRQWGV
jgi:hypothetical protein